MKEWTTPDFRNAPSATNLEEEETVDAPGNDGNASMPEQVKRPNPWRKMMMIIKAPITIKNKTIMKAHKFKQNYVPRPKELLYRKWTKFLLPLNRLTLSNCSITSESITLAKVSYRIHNIFSGSNRINL